MFNCIKGLLHLDQKLELMVKLQLLVEQGILNKWLPKKDSNKLKHKWMRSLSKYFVLKNLLMMFFMDRLLESCESMLRKCWRETKNFQS